MKIEKVRTGNIFLCWYGLFFWNAALDCNYGVEIELVKKVM